MYTSEARLFFIFPLSFILVYKLLPLVTFKVPGEKIKFLFTLHHDLLSHYTVEHPVFQKCSKLQFFAIFIINPVSIYMQQIQSKCKLKPLCRQGCLFLSMVEKNVLRKYHFITFRQLEVIT